MLMILRILKISSEPTICKWIEIKNIKILWYQEYQKYQVSQQPASINVEIKNINDDKLKNIMPATWTQVSSADKQGRRSWRGGKRSFSRDRQVATGASPPGPESEHWH